MRFIRHERLYTDSSSFHIASWHEKDCHFCRNVCCFLQLQLGCSGFSTFDVCSFSCFIGSCGPICRSGRFRGTHGFGFSRPAGGVFSPCRGPSRFCVGRPGQERGRPGQEDPREEMTLLQRSP